MNPISEQVVLEDIQRRTHLKFWKLGGIDTRDESIAKATLPILLEWLRLPLDPNLRHEIYSRFHTQFATEWMAELIEYWKFENYGLARDCLEQCLELNVTRETARSVWTAYQAKSCPVVRVVFLKKLSSFNETHKEVLDALVGQLQEGDFIQGELSKIAKLKDPRIADWFAAQLSSSDPKLRAIAQKALSVKGSTQQPAISYETSPPNRFSELSSTEVDLDEAAATLAKFAAKFDATLPPELADLKFLEDLDLDRWVRFPAASHGHAFWLRMEAADTVEILLTADEKEFTRRKELRH